MTTVPVFRGGRDPFGLFFIASLLLLSFLLNIKGTTNSKKVIGPSLFIPLLVFVILINASLLWTSDFYNGLQQLLMVDVAIMAGYVGFRVLDTQNARQLFLKLFTCGVVATAIISLVMYFDSTFDRASGLFFWPNPLALYLGLGSLYSVSKYLTSQNRWWLGSLIFTLPIFVLTQSLATFGFSAIALLIVLLFSKSNFKTGLVVVGLIGLSIIIANGLVYLKEDAFKTTNIGTPDEAAELVTTKTSGLSDRLDYWQSSIDVIAQNPFGTGVGSFEVEYPKEQESADVGVTNPHNLYIHFALQSGIITIIMFVLFVVHTLVKFTYKTKQLIPPVLVVLWLTHAGFYQTDRYPTLLVIFALLMAMLLLQISQKSKQDRKILSSVLAGSMTLLVMLSGLVFYSRLYAQQGAELLNQFRIGRATQDYESATSLPIYDPDYLGRLGWLSFLQGDYAKANSYYESAIEKDKNDDNHYYLLALSKQRQNNVEAAEANLRRALALDKLNNPRYYVVLSQILIDTGRINEAKNALDFIIKEYPQSTIDARGAFGDLSLSIALVYVQSTKVAILEKNFARAKQEVNRALELQPEHELAKRLKLQLDST